jgi:hypothetical protein
MGKTQLDNSSPNPFCHSARITNQEYNSQALHINSGETEMKIWVILVLALSVASSNLVFAQDMSKDAGKMDKAPAAPLKTIKGTVKADGDKLTFVSDKDNKSWDVMNPEALKGHEGHHVSVSAHVYADKNAIHVMEVKMLKGAN